MKCPDCGGAGGGLFGHLGHPRFEFEPCTTCNGRGQVSYPKDSGDETRTRGSSSPRQSSVPERPVAPGGAVKADRARSSSEVDDSSHAMLMWVVYDHPKDFPHHFVIRRWVLDLSEGQMSAEQDAILCASLAEAHFALRDAGARVMIDSRDPDPAIAEVWV